MAKILVVDDDVVNRKLIVAQLSTDGHLTIEAGDGLDGLRVARSERPQLIISDILMPSMDGYGFVRALRLDEDLRAVPVIFYTAQYHEREANNLALACRVARVLVKPCSQAELLRSVDQALAGVAESRDLSVPRNFDREHLLLLTNKVSERADALAASSARLATLTELVVEIAGEPEPHTLLAKICKGARQLLGARYAVLAVSEPAAGGVYFTTTGIDFLGVKPPTPSLDAGPLADVAAEGRHYRVFDPDGPMRSAGLPEGYPLARAFLAVPVLTPARVYGWVCLADKIGAEGFGDEDEDLLAVIGALVGRSYECCLLQAECQRLRSLVRTQESRAQRPADAPQ
jgi:CheY-like chemotaxis protein